MAEGTRTTRRSESAALVTAGRNDGVKHEARCGAARRDETKSQEVAELEQNFPETGTPPGTCAISSCKCPLMTGGRRSFEGRNRGTDSPRRNNSTTPTGTRSTFAVLARDGAQGCSDLSSRWNNLHIRGKPHSHSHTRLMSPLAGPLIVGAGAQIRFHLHKGPRNEAPTEAPDRR